MSTFYMKAGDLLPLIQDTLRNADGDAEPLTDATVTFVMRPRAGGTSIGGSATIVGDPVNGVVRYTWVDGDTDTPGTYDAEWTAVFAPGTKPLTFPNYSYDTVIISAKIPAPETP